MADRDDEAGANHLGQFIRECRTTLGYTSRQIEAMTRDRDGLSRISHSNLLAIEHGKHVPTFDKVITLSQLFNVPTQYFEDQLRNDMIRVRAAAGPDESAETLAQRGRAALAAGEDAQALELYLQSLAVAMSQPASAERDLLVAEAKLSAAQCRARAGLLRLAKDELEDLLGTANLDPDVARRACLYLSQIHRRRANHRLALLFAEQALATCPENSDLQARVLNAIANALHESGDSPGALAQYQRAHDIFEALGDLRSAAQVSRNMGPAYFRLNDYDKAISCLRSGLAVADTTGDRRGHAFALANLVRALFLRDQVEEAKVLARSAKEAAQELGAPEVMFVSMYYLWRIALREKQVGLAAVYQERLASLYKKLETHCEEAEKWAEEHPSARGIR